MCREGEPLSDSAAGLCLKCATAVFESIIQDSLAAMGVKRG